MHRVIGEQPFADVTLDAATARDFLRAMIRARTFDERALALQRRGWMSGYPPYRGQEATQIGTARAMADEDWFVPTYRQLALQLARGVPMSDLLLFRRGYTEFHSDPSVPIFPQAIPIGTQIPHATGIAMAADYTDTDHAVVCCLGDGATSEGDFHEGLNFAGVFGAPVVFLCENNGWAISLPTERQTASRTIAEKARAYGFDGIRVDGNDPIAVYEVMSVSLEQARAGQPVLVESLTYRQGPHTTADDPDRYRGEVDLPDWRLADPLDRFETYLVDADVVDDETLDVWRTEAQEEVTAAVERAEAAPEPSPSEMFDHVYDTPTGRLREQAAELLE
jgi:pyruvate dehydrogenase E1 component alpha subunit